MKEDEKTAMCEGQVERVVISSVEQYQCPGCVCGGDIRCYQKDSDSLACVKHVAGMLALGVGRFFLGMPTGFNRLGPVDKMVIKIYDKPQDGFVFDKYNVPVWKHLDSAGNTLVRGISPRINWPFVHIFLGDHLKEIDCLEITHDDLGGMD